MATLKLFTTQTTRGIRTETRSFACGLSSTCSPVLELSLDQQMKFAELWDLKRFVTLSTIEAYKPSSTLHSPPWKQQLAT